MKNTKQFLFIFLFFACEAIGQVPGYMGKKLSIGYRADISPRIMDIFFNFGYPVSYNGDELKLYDISIMNNLDIEYVIARQVSLRFMYGTSNNGAFGYVHPRDYAASYSEPYFMELEYPKLSSMYDSYDNNSSYQGNDSKDYDYVRTTSALFRYGLSFSRGFYYSPHGKTKSIYFLQNTTTAEYVLNSQASTLTKINSYGLMGELCTRRIIADAVILEYGISMGYMFGTQFSNMHSIDNAKQYFTSIESKRMLLQLSLGVRYLVPKLRKS
jgi:hypothetical protein